MDGLTQRLAVRSEAAHSSLNDEQSRLVQLIAEGHKPARIARILGITRQAVGQRIDRLAPHFRQAA